MKCVYKKERKKERKSLQWSELYLSPHTHTHTHTHIYIYNIYIYIYTKKMEVFILIKKN